MNLLILEDNACHQTRLIKAIQSGTIQHDIVHFNSVTNAKSFLNRYEKKIDLFFIDVELPDGTGIDFVKTLREIPGYAYTWVVFVTSYSHFIFDAVRKGHCYDFIDKPVDPELVQELIRQRQTHIATQVQTGYQKELVFYTNGVYVKVSPEEVICIEAQKKDCLLYTRNGTYTLKRQSLKKLERDVLHCTEFKKAHRSYLVNQTHIVEIIKFMDKWEIRFKDHPLKVPISSTYEKHFRNVMFHCD